MAAVDEARLLAAWGRSATDGVGLTADEQRTLMAMKEDMRDDVWPKFMEMVEFLGVPDMPRAPSEVTRSKDKYSLWQLWQGQNPFVSDVIDKDLQSSGSWLTNIFPRKEFNDGVSGTRQTIVFESQVMGDVPEMASNQRLGSYQQSETFTLSPKGISFVMPQDFIYAPNGRLLFMQHCKQLERCVDDTLAVGTLWEIKRVGVEMMIHNLPPRPMNRALFFRTVQHFAMYFAIFQKMKAGHVKVQAEAVRRSEHNGSLPLDVEILPTSHALPYVRLADPMNTQYYRGGDTTYSKEIRDEKVRVATPQFNFIQTHHSRPYNFPNMEGPDDLMVEHRTIGEHFIAGDITAKRIPMGEYKSDHRTVRVGHSERVMADVPLLDMLDNSLLYDPNDDSGGLTKHGAAILRKIVYDEACANRRQEEPRFEALLKGSELHRGDGDDDEDAPRPRFGKKGKRKRAAEASDYEPVTLYDLYDAACLAEELLGHLSTWAPQLRRKFLEAAGHELSGSSAHKKAKGPEEKGGEHEINKQVLLNIPITGKVLRALVYFNLRVPIKFIGRRNITLETGQYIALHKGGETGTIYTGKTIINLSRNTKQRLIGVDLNFDVTTSIHLQGRNNVVYIPDVMVLDYLGGYETTFMGYGDNRADDELQHEKCIRIYAVNPSWVPQNEYLDDTGVVNRDVLLPDGHSSKLCYPTAGIYSDYWKFGPPSNPFLFESFVEQARAGWTFSLQGFQEYSVPTKHLTHPDAGFVLGQGHLGTRITSNTFKVFRGEVSHLTDATPESVGGMTRRVD